MRLPALLVGTSGYGLGNRNGSLLFSAAYVARKFHDEYLSVGAAVNPGTARSETQFASAQRGSNWRSASKARNRSRSASERRFSVSARAASRIQFAPSSGFTRAAASRTCGRIDVRWTRFIDTQRGRVSFFAEIFNLFNTANVRGYYENTNFNSFSRTVTITRQAETDIPRLPSVGFSWEF